MTFALVAVFVAIVTTGPAGREWLEHRRARAQRERDAPLAKVVYLPSAACRDRAVVCRPDECVSQTTQQGEC